MITTILSTFGAHCKSEFFGLPSWNKYLEVTHDSAGGCTVVDFGLSDIWLIAAAILEVLIRVAGLISVIYVMWGGFRYLTSQGDPQKTNSARSTIIYALVGLGVTIVASTTVSFIFNQLFTGSGDTGLGNATPGNQIELILNIAYGIAGGIAALMVVIGSFKYVTSAGDPQKASSALNTIIYALVGLVVVIFATLITGFVVTSAT